MDVGQEAPNVTLKLTNREKVNQSFELRQAYEKGTTILYFFPAVFTGVCTRSSCELRDDLEDFEALNAQLYSISTDMPFTHNKFILEYDINYPILSDWNKELIHALGIVDNEFAGFFKGVAKRALFVIEDHRISYRWIADNPGQYPPFDELKEHLRQNY